MDSPLSDNDEPALTPAAATAYRDSRADTRRKHAGARRVADHLGPGPAGTSEVEALNELDSELSQGLELGRGLDALGDEMAAGLARVSEHRRDQSASVGIFVDGTDQRASSLR